MQKTLLERLDPTSTGRVEFVNLHAWARKFLSARGLSLDAKPADDLFNKTWLRASTRTVLAAIQANPGYWHEEIRFVIKGRGVTTLDEYLTVERHGRRVALHPRYGRQSIYPGGFRLADAGIDIRGRARVLNLNYRNGSAILRRAQRFLESHSSVVGSSSGGTSSGVGSAGIVGSYEDIDGVPDDQSVTFADERTGGVTALILRDADGLDRALLDAVSELRVGPRGRGSAAVLCHSVARAGRYRAILAHNGIEVQDLEDYDGHTTSAVKVGTFHRVKGLEFKHVFMPGFEDFIRIAERRGHANPDWLRVAYNQVYVGMTRARDTLWLATDESA